MAYLSMLSYSVFQVIVIKIPGYLMRTPHYRLSGPESKRAFCDMNECRYMRQAMHVINISFEGPVMDFVSSSSGAQRASGLSVD